MVGDPNHFPFLFSKEHLCDYAMTKTHKYLSREGKLIDILIYV